MGNLMSTINRAMLSSYFGNSALPYMYYIAVYVLFCLRKSKQKKVRQLLAQGCALRKITRSPKVPNYDIQGAQHKACIKEIRLSGRPKTKVNRLRHPGTLRAQPYQATH